MSYSWDDYPHDELREEFVGTGDNMSPFIEGDSSPRRTMTDKYYGQRPYVEGAEPRRFFTGAEPQYGQYNFGATMPDDGIIIKIIPKYRKSIGKINIFKNNPETLYIYEYFDNDKPAIGCVVAKRMFSNDLTLGFEFKQTSPHIGQALAKDTQITQIPAVDDIGNYNTGVEAVTAFISHTGVTEDGALISESFAEKLTTTVIGTREFSFGKQYYPLNTFGDLDNYKPLLNIGETIPESGLLMAFRKYDPMFDIVNMSPKMMLGENIDYDEDKCVFVNPTAAGGVITDITIKKDPGIKFTRIPVGTTEQIDFYYDLHQYYYRELISFYEKMKKERGRDLRLSPELQLYIERAMVACDTYDERNGDKQPVGYNYKSQTLDDVKITITYAKKVKAQVPFKISNTHGSKAVVVGVWPDERMPVTESGVRADLIMDDRSVVKRLNMGVFYEQYFNASRHATEVRIREHYDKGEFDKAQDILSGFYETISKPHMEVYTNTYKTVDDKRKHLDEVYKNGMYIWSPTYGVGRPKLDVVRDLKKKYPAEYGPITFIGEKGDKRTTVSNVLIGSTYIMLLNKLGDGCTAVTSSKLQPHGLPAKLPPALRYNTPCLQNPVKFFDEATIRQLVSTVGPEVVTELIERSNSPEVSRLMYKRLLTSENPSDIDVIHDRNRDNLGVNRALVFLRHYLNCSGVEIVDTPFDPDSRIEDG